MCHLCVLYGFINRTAGERRAGGVCARAVAGALVRGGVRRQRRERHVLPLVRPGHRRVGRAERPQDARRPAASTSTHPPVRDACAKFFKHCLQSIEICARGVESYTVNFLYA